MPCKPEIFICLIMDSCSNQHTCSMNTHTHCQAFGFVTFYWQVNARKDTIIFIMWTLKISDSAEGANGGTHGTPVTELAILARRHEILTASITGVLIEGPVALHDIARVNAAALETLMNGLAVITEFHHLTLEIWPIIDPDAVGSITFLQNIFK